MTHELGHYLLLDHIWGGSGGCNDDDLVNDTPVSSQEYYGCPNLGVTSCSSNDMHMSYMDYTNDACMYMFSAGQIARAENYVATSLQNVVNNTAAVCGDVDPPSPTCNDGVQNGDETGIDCGGSCEPCETVPTCNDGIQNGDETGVDCGGSCAPCEPEGGCQTPSNISSNILSTSSVELTWDAVPNAIKYKVKYRPQGTSQWINVPANSNFKILNNLLANTTYQYRVRTICNGERSPWSPFDTFTTNGNNEEDCLDLNFSLGLDAYGNETTWELVNENGVIIDNGGPYGNSNEGDVINESWCLVSGCYTLTVYDDWGDGICCDYGEGYYEILDTDGNVLFYSDGQFGYSETVQFCIEDFNFGNMNTSKVAKNSNIEKKPRKRTSK